VIELASPKNFGDKANPSIDYVLGWVEGPIFCKIMQGRSAKGSCLLQQEVHNENMKYGDIAYIQESTLTMMENHGKPLLSPCNIRSNNLGHKFKDQGKFKKRNMDIFNLG
jgi:hypothetical protein